MGTKEHGQGLEQVKVELEGSLDQQEVERIAEGVKALLDAAQLDCVDYCVFEILIRNTGTGEEFLMNTGRRRLAETGYEIIIKFMAPAKPGAVSVETIVAQIKEQVNTAVAETHGVTIKNITHIPSNNDHDSNNAKSSQWKFYVIYIVVAIGGILVLALVYCWCTTNTEEH